MRGETIFDLIVLAVVSVPVYMLGAFTGRDVLRWFGLDALARARESDDNKCGCEIIHTRPGGDFHAITFCTLHAAAGELFAALAVRVDHADYCVGHAACAHYPAAKFMTGRALVSRLREVVG